MKKKITFIISILISTTIMLSGCGNKASKEKSSNIINISGSTSVGPVVELEGEIYGEKNINISVEVNETGSSSGIKDAITGISEIGMSSRDLDSDEDDILEKVEIALDGIAVIVNNANGIKNLTLKQVRDIFTGKVNNWSEVGGVDAPIVVISRESGSGTRGAFEDIVGYEEAELAKQALIVNATGAIKENVRINKNAVGYMSIGYLDDNVSAVSIDNVEPTEENVKSKVYKIQRPFLLVYKNNSLTDNGKDFIDFILSEEGQNIIEEENLVRIK